MLLERKGPFLKFLGHTLNEVIGCYWVCVFVCLFPYSSETFNPNELKFWGKISLWGANDFRQKKLPDCQTVRRKTKKTLAKKTLKSASTSDKCQATVSIKISLDFSFKHVSIGIYYFFLWLMVQNLCRQMLRKLEMQLASYYVKIITNFSKK